MGDLILRGTRIATLRQLREQVLELGHKGHPGIVVMRQRLHSKVWWPNMDRDVEQWCKRCYRCQLVSKPERPEPIVRTDFMGPLPSGHNLFAVVDYYSRWVEIAMTTTPNAKKTVEALEKMLTTHGLLNSITTDNRPQFISQYFKQYCEQNGIIHRHITALWPQANGEIERQNRSFLKRLKIAHSEKKNWRDELQKYLFMYRVTPQSTMGVSPAELLFRRKLRTKLPELGNTNINDFKVRDRDGEHKEKGKMYADEKRKAVPSTLKTGDQVFMKQDRENELSTTFNPKLLTVLDKLGNSLLLESDQDVAYKRNITHAKKY